MSFIASKSLVHDLIYSTTLTVFPNGCTTHRGTSNFSETAFETPGRRVGGSVLVYNSR
jgi:hypothetical protein